MVISDKIYIPTHLIEKYSGDICNLFTYRNPEYYRRKQQKLSVKGINPSLYNYKFETLHNINHLVLPRGCLSRLKEFLISNKIFFRILDERLSLPTINIKLKETVLEEQQYKIINTLVENDGGLVESPPGSGKTIAMLGFIDRIKQPVLILVHEEFLQNQWIEEINKRLEGSFKIGRWDGKHKIRGNIDVGLTQTVHKQVDLDRSFLDHYGIIIQDEVHKIPAPTFMKIVNNSKSKYRVGVTGTIERKDQMHILTYDVIGKTLLTIAPSEIKHRITSFETDIVNTNIKIELPVRKRWNAQSRKKEDMLDITNAITLLTKNTQRNILILNKIIEDIEEGYFPLVLSDRVDHVKCLDFRLKELGYTVAMLIGSKGKKNYNWEHLRQDATIQCVVASTKKAEEGLDWPALSSIFLTCPSTNLPKIKQRIGRIRRRQEGKKIPIVHDFIDNLAYYTDPNKGIVHILKYSSRKRLNFYKKLMEDYEE